MEMRIADAKADLFMSWESPDECRMRGATSLPPARNHVIPRRVEGSGGMAGRRGAGRVCRSLGLREPDGARCGGDGPVGPDDLGGHGCLQCGSRLVECRLH